MFVALLHTFLLMSLYYEILAMTLGQGNSVMTDTAQLVSVPLTKNLHNTMWNVGSDAILPGMDKTVQVNIISAGDCISSELLLLKQIGITTVQTYFVRYKVAPKHTSYNVFLQQ